MNQQTKQVSAINGHACAVKRLESDVLAAQLEEFLATGGTIKSVPGYSPKERPAAKPQISHGLTGYNYHHCRCKVCVSAINEYQRKYKQKARQTRQDQILELVRSGLNRSSAIGNALGIDVKQANCTLRQLEEKGLISGVYAGNSNRKTWTTVAGEQAA